MSLFNFSILKSLIAVAMLLPSVAVYADFSHQSWDSLLDQHVTMTNGGKASVVDYIGMQADKSQLTDYLNATSKVSQSGFDRWNKNDQLAFLINVYNARTVELVLTKYPNIKSIKDIGSLFSSPWKQDFIPLLGKTRSLDDVEHTLIRGSQRYNDPRIHFAVNCASIGCPALQNDAFTGKRLDRQLEQVTAKFLADNSRNRIKGNTLEISPLFKWYKEDFATSWRDSNDLAGFLGRYSQSLGLDKTQAASLKQGKINISYTDYDWRLNKK
ncbi:DUF547 domain-containing protein [Psychrobacter sp. CAL346-MNA-CIBAN-0220]|uniref:DUF547 domain-containing protein n=1 Tax=Psychrobacter sp. CAL346-MNA-CIBAN-0220 TaxID=3140457 RepID=UPI0033312287